MATPQMESDTTAIDRLTGVWPLTPASSIHEARAHLRNTGEPAAVVFRSDRPVGVVTRAALASAKNANALVVTVIGLVETLAAPLEPFSTDEDVESLLDFAFAALLKDRRNADRIRRHAAALPVTAYVSGDDSG